MLFASCFSNREQPTSQKVVILFVCILLLTHGDIEANPGPTKKKHLITFHAVTGM